MRANQLIRRFHDGIAWLAQIVMFLMLGLLVFPSRLLPQAWVGIGLGLVLALVARPVAAALCLSWFGWKPREIGLAGWIGLRGAMPVILATIPIMKGLPDGDRIFHLVFFIVVVSTIVPGAGIVQAALRSRLGWRVAGPRNAALELHLARRLDRELHEFPIDDRVRACGLELRELPLPDTCAVVLVMRADEPLPARGSTRLAADDLLYVMCSERDLETVEHWLRPEVDTVTRTKTRSGA